MAQPFPPIPPNINQLAGPAFLGIYLNGCLFGVLVLQYYSYCTRFREDSKLLRCIVHIQMLLEAAQTVMTLADGFHWFVYGYGNVSKLEDFFLSWLDAPMMTAILALISQMVYTWRIYCVGEWKIIPFIISLFACGQLAGGIGLSVLATRVNKIVKGDNGFHIFLFLWTVSSAVADILIAISMTYILLSATKGLYQKRTTVITRLITLIIETNTATATVALVVLFTMVLKPIAPPATTYYICPSYVLGKLYSNSFIAMLNNRHSKGGESNATDIIFQRSYSLGAPQNWDNQSNRLEPFKGSGIKSGVIIISHAETPVSLDFGRQV